MRSFVLVFLAFAAGACSRSSEPATKPLPPGVEAMSLDGKPFAAPPLAADKRAEREKQLEEARAMPDSADRDVWVGRRLAALGRFQEAIAALSDGIAKHPDDARLYRHRGHRYLSTRKFDLAAADLERASKLIEGKPDEVEPDLALNPKAGPVNSLRSSIWYHLALAYYLKGDYANALRCDREGMKVADNPDRTSSTSYWMYLALRQLGQHDEAKRVLEPIKADWVLVESGSYHKLLLVFRGDKKADDVAAAARNDADGVAFPTVGYGLATWYRLNGEKDRADALRREVLTSPNWHSFGFIASEAEVAATRGTPESR